MVLLLAGTIVSNGSSGAQTEIQYNAPFPVETNSER